jgi:hypothetical protein
MRNLTHMPPSQSLATTESFEIQPGGPPTATKVRVPTKDGPKAIRGKLKLALDMLIYGDENGKPLDWNEAARKAQFTPQAMRKALERAHVVRYLREQKQVFRASVSAANILVARSIRDDGENDNARMKAISYLDGEGQQQQTPSGQVLQPGIVVKVVVNTAPAVDDIGIIEVNPAHDSVD